jgi:hypothetical protein
MSAEGAAFNSHGREAVGHVAQQIEAQRADILVGNLNSCRIFGAGYFVSLDPRPYGRGYFINEPSALFLNKTGSAVLRQSP